jgi:hypothetical protein
MLNGHRILSDNAFVEMVEQWMVRKRIFELEVLHKMSIITGIEFDNKRSDFLQRYEEMLSRLDGTYQLPK